MTRSACVALALSLTGCGTAANLTFPEKVMIPGPPRMEVYGGVGNDVRWIKDLAATRGPIALLLAAGLVLDLPLSAVADTLTLPVTLGVKVDRAYTTEPADQSIPTQWRKFWFNEQPAQPPAEGMP
jgi:uncharacterized protein YceK